MVNETMLEVHATTDLAVEMTILRVVHYPMFGGPHNEAVRLEGVFRRRAIRTIFLLPDQPGNAIDRLNAAGVEVVTLPLHRLRGKPDPRLHVGFLLSFVPEVLRIKRLIQTREIDLVVIGGLVNPHAAFAARLADVPVVWQIVDSGTPRVLRTLIMPLVSRLAHAVMYDGKALIDLHGGTTRLRSPHFVYYPPVDAQQFVPSPERRAETRANLGIPREAIVVGMVANLTPMKGIEYFVRAAGLIAQAHPDAWFLVVGARYETHRSYPRQLAVELQQSGVPPERFIFAGGRTDVERWYPAMDVKLITSVSEATTTTAMAAMACGIPVVATNVGAVREVVEDGCTGLVVPPLDPSALARATLRLLADPDLRMRIGAAGRDRAVERFDIRPCADTFQRAFMAAVAHHSVRAAGDLVPVMTGEPETVPTPDLQSRLVCPACRGVLTWSTAEAACTACNRTYPVVDGIPILLPKPAPTCLNPDGTPDLTAHKQVQAAFYDNDTDPEFEVTRPRGTARLYQWLLGEKFRRSLAGLGQTLGGRTALTVCGGSGMDAEYLVRAGATVIASDLSLGAARRTRERARRYGLAILPIVADIEHLPFADSAVDLVYVHDGLHHLEHPGIGVAEMARVAAWAVSVTEPADAAGTAIAARIGLAQRVEEAGNRVERLSLAVVAAELQRSGFAVVHTERYAMYYRHRPGSVFAALSFPGVFPITRLGWTASNALFGRVGNKLTVQAVRPSSVGKGT